MKFKEIFLTLQINGDYLACQKKNFKKLANQKLTKN